MNPEAGRDTGQTVAQHRLGTRKGVRQRIREEFEAGRAAREIQGADLLRGHAGLRHGGTRRVDDAPRFIAPRIDQALLVEWHMQGRFDLLCPPSTSQALAARWPDAKMSFVEAAGHTLYDPGVRNAVMKGIADVASKITK